MYDKICETDKKLHDAQRKIMRHCFHMIDFDTIEGLNEAHEAVDELFNQYVLLLRLREKYIEEGKKND